MRVCVLAPLKGKTGGWGAPSAVGVSWTGRLDEQSRLLADPPGARPTMACGRTWWWRSSCRSLRARAGLQTAGLVSLCIRSLRAATAVRGCIDACARAGNAGLGTSRWAPMAQGLHPRLGTGGNPPPALVPHQSADRSRAHPALQRRASRYQLFYRTGAPLLLRGMWRRTRWNVDGPCDARCRGHARSDDPAWSARRLHRLHALHSAGEVPALGRPCREACGRGDRPDPPSLTISQLHTVFRSALEPLGGALPWAWAFHGQVLDGRFRHEATLIRRWSKVEATVAVPSTGLRLALQSSIGWVGNPARTTRGSDSEIRAATTTATSTVSKTSAPSIR